MSDWAERARRAAERYEDGAARLPLEPDERQRQLTRMGNAAWAAGLSLLMAGRDEEAQGWLGHAADRYRESWPEAPPESWGRPIGAMKARLIAGDADRARDDARWALDAGAASSESPIGRYAAALAQLVLGQEAAAAQLAPALGDGFPQEVADAVAAISAGDSSGYESAIRRLLTDFEGRQAFLEDIPVADTVLVLQVLAARRGLAVSLSSPLLPFSR